MYTPPLPSLELAIRKAVIPAAGLGTRLRPLTNAFPKELLPIGRLPVLAHLVNELRGAGISDALFIVSDQKPQIRSFFGDVYGDDEVDRETGRTTPPIRCSYVVQKHQRGLGDAILYAEEWVAGAQFAVAFGDCIIDAADASAPLRRMLNVHRTQGAGATVLAEEILRENVYRYGVLAPFESGDSETEADALRLSDIVEKPSPEFAPSNLVVAGRWAFNASIFQFLKQQAVVSHGELYLTEAVRAMVSSGATFWAAPLAGDERRLDIGNYETFFTSFIRAAMRDSEFGLSARRAAAEEIALDCSE